MTCTTKNTTTSTNIIMTFTTNTATSTTTNLSKTTTTATKTMSSSTTTTNTITKYEVVYTQKKVQEQKLQNFKVNQTNLLANKEYSAVAVENILKIFTKKDFAEHTGIQKDLEKYNETT